MRTGFEMRKTVQGPAHWVKGRGFGAYQNRESQEIIHSSNLPKSESPLTWIFSYISINPIRSVRYILNLFIFFLCHPGLCVCVLSCFSRVWLWATVWTVACLAPLSMRFSRQEYWSGLPRPPPGDLPDPRIEPGSPALWEDSLPLSHQGSPILV